MSDVRVRPLGSRDVRACADLHLRAFPGFFLSELGARFLREFYSAFVNDRDAIALVAEVDGEVRGVVVGTTRPDGFFTRLLRRRWYAFAWASMATTLRNPRAVPRVARSVRYRGAVPVDASGALLSSICVDPGVPGSGGLLIQQFVEAVRDSGFTSAYLTTDADNNDRVNEFYRRSGWQLKGTYATPEGRRMHCYTWQDVHQGAEEGG